MDYCIPYAVENLRCAPEWGNFQIQGEIARRLDRFLRVSILSDRGKEILEEAILCFRDKKDDDFHFGLWRGEFAGKLLLSEVRLFRMTANEELGNMLRDAVSRLLSYQRADGYLGTYKDSRNVFRADTSLTVKECGWECDYNWNIWGRKYTLWGLLESAMALEEPQILECADRFGEQLVRELAELKTRVKDTGVMSGLPSCSILKPILLLYRLTGKPDYLACALSIADEWDKPDMECPSLIRNGLSASAPYHWYTKDGEQEWISKAYEMMSCYDGLCELYRVTGNPRYLDACEGFFQALLKYESNILGSVSYCERFADAAFYPDAATELCDIIHWMRLCYELYSVTGKAVYMDAFERAFLNAFLAGVYEDGKTCAFFIRSHGRHWDAEMQCSTKYQNCCLNNMPRGFVNAAQSCIMNSGEEIFVNLYLPCSVSFGQTHLRVSDGYTTDGRVRVDICSERDEKLSLRIPSWSKTTKVNGTEVGDADYYRITVPAGENTVCLEFDMSVRVVDFAGEVRDLPSSDYHVLRYCGRKGAQSEFDRELMLKHPMSTLRRGPIILARSKKIGSDANEMFSQKTIFGQKVTAAAEDVSSPEGYLFRGTIRIKGEGTDLVYDMCDYASAADYPEAEMKTFTLFV